MEDHREETSVFIHSVLKVLSFTFRGLHHLHGKVRDFDLYAEYNAEQVDFATYDGKILTDLVFAAHEESLRISLIPGRRGNMVIRFHHNDNHPNLNTALQNFAQDKNNWRVNLWEMERNGLSFYWTPGNAPYTLDGKRK